MLFAWLLMLVLPAQGFAAASLVCCTEEAQHFGAAALVHEQGTVVDHDTALSGHEHAGHAPATADHHCGTCASCCHGVGIADSAPRAALAQARAPKLPEPLVRISNEPLPLPERPPRA